MDIDEPMYDEPMSKRVHFPAHLEHVVEVERCDDKNQWYSADDFNQFRQAARQSGSPTNDHACSKALHMFSSQRCDQNVLDYWSLHGQSIRGFESVVNPNLGMARKVQRGRCIKSVLIAQMVAQEQEEAGNDMDAVKFIAYVASKESSKAKQFALMMGRADENAIYRPQPVMARRCSQIVAASA